MLDWVDQWSYLGIVLKSNIFFDCNVEERTKKFYKCLNAILRVEGRSNDLVMLQLLETHCVPILTYAVEVLHISDVTSRRQLRVAYNSIFRKIFGYRRYESVTILQGFLSRPTWEQLCEKRRHNFNKRCFLSERGIYSCIHYTELIEWEFYLASYEIVFYQIM